MDECDTKQKMELPEVGGNAEESDEEIEHSDCSSSCKSCSDLQKRLAEEQERCNVLRSNIHKVSANWFNRKYKISESDMDADTSSNNGETSQTDDAKIKEVEESTMMSPGLSKDMSKLVGIIAQKSAQLDLSETHCRDLKRKMREYESMIDDKENIIHGLKDQLESYLNDNQKLSNQLKNLTCLFLQLEKAENESVSPAAADADSADSSESVSAPPLPSPKDYEEMASSVSRTYIKLKDLIYEKRSLVTEIERLNTLNVELQRRVLAQENRLVNVTDALHQTWLVVSDLKDQHAKLHEDELVFKYELQEKREILTKLRKELEMSRQKWEIIRQKNLESELEYASLREMLRERRMASKESETTPEEEKEPDEAVCLHPEDATFDPPVDLLLEMGLEYGIIGENAEMTETVLNVIKGEDIRTNRLEHLEEHCSLLYTKLINSTSKSLSLASRLTRLHSQYGEEEEEEYEDDNLEYEHGEEMSEDSDTDGDETPYITDANHLAIIESVLSSPASEEYDTAYVSETDAEPNTLENFAVLDLLATVNESITPQETEERAIEEEQGDIEFEENCDHLSKTLINFLPRKIEILRQQNTTLENRISEMEIERNTSNDKFQKAEKEKQKLEEEIKILTKEMTFEKLQKRQVEEQLKHLGKCVDELKLKHDAEKKGHKKQKEEEDEKDKEETVEERREDERKKEDDKLKREVELLKREMDISKKEKELKKREKDIISRENKEVKSDDAEQVDCSKEQNMFDLITSIVTAMEENRPGVENIEGATTINQSGGDHNSISIAKVSGEETASNISSNGVLVYPIRLRAEEEITCYFTPSENVSLFILQLQSLKAEDTPSTSKELPNRGSDSPSTSKESLTGDLGPTSMLVPSTLLPAHSSSSVVLNAKSQVMCVIAVRHLQNEHFEVKFQLTRRDQEK